MNAAHRARRGLGTVRGLRMIKGGANDHPYRHLRVVPIACSDLSVVRGGVGDTPRIVVRVPMMTKILQWLFGWPTNEEMLDRYLAASPGACGPDSTKPPPSEQGFRLLPTQE